MFSWRYMIQHSFIYSCFCIQRINSTILTIFFFFKSQLCIHTWSKPNQQLAIMHDFFQTDKYFNVKEFMDKLLWFESCFVYWTNHFYSKCFIRKPILPRSRKHSELDDIVKRIFKQTSNYNIDDKHQNKLFYIFGEDRFYTQRIDEIGFSSVIFKINNQDDFILTEESNYINKSCLIVYWSYSSYIHSSFSWIFLP